LDRANGIPECGEEAVAGAVHLSPAEPLQFPPDDGRSAFVRAGRIKVVGQIEHFAANEVVLARGAQLRPDVVLLTTGYRPGLRTLAGHLGVLR